MHTRKQWLDLTISWSEMHHYYDIISITVKVTKLVSVSYNIDTFLFVYICYRYAANYLCWVKNNTLRYHVLNGTEGVTGHVIYSHQAATHHIRKVISFNIYNFSRAIEYILLQLLMAWPKPVPRRLTFDVSIVWHCDSPLAMVAVWNGRSQTDTMNWSQSRFNWTHVQDRK